MNRLQQRFSALMCLLLCAVAQAQTPVEFYQTWSGSGLRGWTNTDGNLTLSNPGGYLSLAFGSQGQPQIQAGIAYTNMIPGILPTNIAFAFKAFQYSPSAVRLYAHSTALNRYWYTPITAIETNVWNTVDVPVSFNSTWICDPGLNQNDFLTDMLTVDWIGVYVMRHGNQDSQMYGIDDFLIQGVIPPSGLTISGTVTYEGEQSGTIYVSAVSPYTSLVEVLTVPDDYVMTNVPLGQSFTITGYRDANGNNTQEFWEATGAWAGNPANLFVDGLTGADIAMSDPTSPEGLPYFWLNQHFGVTEPGGGGGSGDPSVQGDPDEDRFGTGDEYWAGTDPTNPLSFFMVDMLYTNNGGSTVVQLMWDSIPNRTYGVWRSTSMGGGFSKIESAIPTTPSQNTYLDLTATGAGPYFYRVEVER